jgi:nucleoside-diphosphate-sugar epimerase
LESVYYAEKFDMIVHTACEYGRASNSIKGVIETNIAFPVRLLELANTSGVSGFINADTMLPSLVSAYALSKSQFVEWLQYFSSGKMRVINMKIEHMYGSGDDSRKFINWILSQLRHNVPSIELTKGEQKRDFIYIDDVVSAFLVVYWAYQRITEVFRIPSRNWKFHSIARYSRNIGIII